MLRVAMVGLAVAVTSLAPVEAVSGVLYDGTSRRCSVSPAPGGYYVPRHCIESHGRLTLYGAPVAVGALDRVRDLAHLPVDGVVAPTMRTAALGETLEVRIADRTPLRLRAVRRAPVVRGDGWYTIDAEDGWLALVACRVEGRAVIGGDSGAGTWTRDGALSGIIVAAQGADSGPPYGADDDCGPGQRVLIVEVP